MSFRMPSKPTKNYGLKDMPDWMPGKKNQKFESMQTAFRRSDQLQLSELKQEIDLTDSEISKEVSRMQMSLRRQPTDAEIRQNRRVSSLLNRRDELLGAYETVVRQHRFHNAKLQTMQTRDPLKEAKKSFAGIRRSNPFTEFRRSPVQVPVVTSQHRVMKDIKKRGTQWDPNFSLSDVSVNPKIKNYYKRYIKRW